MCSYKLISVFIMLMIVNDYGYKAQALKTFVENGNEIILALEKEEVYMECKTDAPRKHCGFVHPIRKTYSKGTTTSDGKCYFYIHPSPKDSGTWLCQIGNEPNDAKTIKKIELKVVGQFAAVHSNVTVVHATTFTVHCAATKEFVSLSYCRFDPPVTQPFIINSGVTESMPHLIRYHFPRNRSLASGDCAVVVRGATYNDHGIWTCRAGLNDGHEYTADIYVKVEGLYTLSEKVITIGVVSSVALLTLIVYFAYMHQTRSVRRRNDTVESHELEELPPAPAFSRPGTPRPARSSIPPDSSESPSDSSEPMSQPETGSQPETKSQPETRSPPVPAEDDDE